MFYKILLSAVLTVALTSATAWAQCHNGCQCDTGCATGGCDSGGCDLGGCDSGGCGCVGQDYFAGGGGFLTGGGVDRYTRFFGGVNFLDTISDATGDTEFQTGWGAGLALGRRKGNRRAEVELSYRDNSFDNIAPFDGGVSQVSNMYNVLFDLNRFNLLGGNAYIGGGIGLTYGRASVLGLSTSDTGFSYQAIAGLSRQMRNGARGFVEYRYLSSELEFAGDFNFNNHDIFFGIELNR